MKKRFFVSAVVAVAIAMFAFNTMHAQDGAGRSAHPAAFVSRRGQLLPLSRLFGDRPPERRGSRAERQHRRPQSRLPPGARVQVRRQLRALVGRGVEACSKAPTALRFDRQGDLWYIDAADNIIFHFDKEGRTVGTLGTNPEPWTWLTHVIERAVPGRANSLSGDRHRLEPRRQHVRRRRLRQFARREVRQGRQLREGVGRARRAARQLQHAAQPRRRQQRRRLCGRPRQQPHPDVRHRRQPQSGVEPADGAVVAMPHERPDAGDVRRQRRPRLQDGSTGKILGAFGRSGRMPGTLDSIHQLACPDEKTLYLANLYASRLDKWVTE